LFSSFFCGKIGFVNYILHYLEGENNKNILLKPFGFKGYSILQTTIKSLYKGEMFWAEANNKADQNAEWASLIIGDYSSSKDLCSPVILQVASYKIELRDGFSPSVLAAVLKVIHSLC
jgi:hypothetical protein